MSSFLGETKTSSTSENITTSTFYTNKLPPSTNLPNDIFDKSAELSKHSIQDNPYDQRTDQSKCKKGLHNSKTKTQIYEYSDTGIVQISTILI